MSEPKDINWYDQICDLIEYAEVVITPEGNTYYRLPQWFQEVGTDFIMHSDLPKDLAAFITKAQLGGDNPQPIKAKL